jgi:proteasome lid subunit RPN8/RPN11
VVATVRKRRRKRTAEADDMELLIRLFVAGSRLSEAVAIGDLAGGQQRLSEVRAVMSEIRQGRTVAPDRPSVPVRANGRIRFVVDSLFLAGAKKFLVGDHPDQVAGVRERFHFCTGIKLDAETYALTHIVPVDFAEQSAIHLRVDTSSAISALAALDHWGTPLVAHCHSHPGRGAGATFPSMTDRRFQDILERGSHIAIGLIFSQDGYLRCFAGDESRFEISVFGKQVTEIERNVYKIELGDEKLPIANVGGRIG